MNIIRKIIRECFNINEERISNIEAAKKVNDKKNFIGSHCFGEDIGAHVNKPGELYVVYSYGEQHPLYLWKKDEKLGNIGNKGSWYYNYENYYLKDGNINIWTQKHLKILKPKGQLFGRDGSSLKQMIRDYKQKNGIKKNSHKNLEPGKK